MKRFFLLLTILISSFYLAIRFPQMHRNLLLKYVGKNVVEVVKMSPFGGIEGGGTGFQIKENGTKYIITNAHVCHAFDGGDGYAFIKEEDGRTIRRKIIQISTMTDLCAIEGDEDLGYLTIGGDVYTGEILAAVGHPLLLPTNVSYGAVLEESVFVVGDETVDAYLSTIQTLPGNSGSPVVNYRGQVVGVIFAGDSSVFWGLFIPSLDLRAFVSSL